MSEESSITPVEVDLTKLVNYAITSLQESIDFIAKESGVPLHMGANVTSFAPQPERYFGNVKSPIYGVPGVSDITICFFKPGDGTGSQANRVIQGLLPKYTPRDKTGYAELCIPTGVLFVNPSDERFIKGFSALSECMIDEKRPFMKKDLDQLSDYDWTSKPLTAPAEDFHDLVMMVRGAGSFSSSSNVCDVTYVRNGLGQKHMVFYDAHALFGTSDLEFVEKEILRGNQVIQSAAFIGLSEENNYTSRLVELAMLRDKS